MGGSTLSSQDRLNGGLARLLGVGTLTSCGLIMIGMLVPALGLGPQLSGHYLVSTGIILLIVLPTMRVATMAAWFLLNGDRQFALIAACVLAIIVASTLLGIRAG